MSSTRIASLHALEILDSRGCPTVQVTLILGDGAQVTASIPSGASTGANEAVELRDHDPARYHGKGVLRVIANIHDVIAPALRGADVTRLEAIDERLLELDGTENKSGLGANALLGVSQACARAAARAANLQLHEFLRDGAAARLPMPMFNCINGGRHADSGLDIQEFMLVPLGAPTFSEAVRWAAETIDALHDLLHRQGYTVSVGDEGGFAPMLQRNEEAMELIEQAIQSAGYKPGEQIGIALDAAASGFHVDGRYRLARESYRDKTSGELIEVYEGWLRKHPIVSIEDGLAEDDWDGFVQMTARLGEQVQVVGDDLLVTNTRFIRQAIERKACNAALIKLNQIGTVSETIAAVDMCRKAGWDCVISHRSGETVDTFIADFAVAMGARQLKAGSLRRGERIAKYNRLLEIEQALGDRAQFGW